MLTAFELADDCGVTKPMAETIINSLRINLLSSKLVFDSLADDQSCAGPFQDCGKVHGWNRQPLRSTALQEGCRKGFNFFQKGVSVDGSS